MCVCFFSSRRRHTRCALVTGVQTCALPITPPCSTEIRRYDTGALRDAASLIRAGQPVAVPTETVNGLAADATSAEAVARIYAVKGRPSFNPLIVHVAELDMAKSMASRSEEQPSETQSLMRTTYAVYC